MDKTNLEIIRSNTIPLTITVRDGATAKNITGYTFFFTAKEKSADVEADAIISKKITSLSDPTHGIFLITLSAADTTIDAKNYVYDIKAVSGAGVVTTLFMGVLTVIQNITTRIT